jgi:GNAT superfamily N-acetyltransferase
VPLFANVSVGVVAGPDDLHAVAALLDQRTKWLRARNIPQWTRPYPHARLVRDIGNGEVWCWRHQADVIATATVSFDRPSYYPEHVWTEDARVKYLCRLAVSTAWAGHAVGVRVMRELQADARTHGVRAMRLDVTAANPFLERYYATGGFARVATGDIFGEPALFLEKPL